MTSYTFPPPPSSGEKNFNSIAWQHWFQLISQTLITVTKTISTSVNWSDVNKTGSDIRDIQTRNHNDLQSIQGGATADYQHLTTAQETGLTGGSATTLHTHAHNNLTSIQGGSPSDYQHLTTAQLNAVNSITSQSNAVMIWLNS